MEKQQDVNEEERANREAKLLDGSGPSKPLEPTSDHSQSNINQRPLGLLPLSSDSSTDHQLNVH